MIIVNLCGGLGNQMFQYATALALRQHWRCPVKVDIRSYKNSNKRSYLLDQCKHAPAIADAQDRAMFEGISASLQRCLHRFIPSYQPIYKKYHQPDFRYDANLINLQPPLLIASGYFQSEKNFLSHASTIRDSFQLNRPLPPRSQSLWSAIKSSSWPVALHVRRGDYTDPDTQKVHPLCTRSYYQRAVNHVNRMSSQHASYFVFSDDIVAAREMLSFIPNATFVDGHASEPLVDMILIATCRSMIIANSSFSWWGAWLNPNPDKVVIAPRLWFQENANLDASDLIPSEWISL